MFPDPDAIRALAHRLRSQAEEVRREADRLVRLLDTAPWSGRAADAARARGRERAGTLVRTAALHDTAAGAVDRHAREVERRQDLIAQAQRLVTGLVDAVVEEVVEEVVEGADLARDLINQLALPPPASPGWLDVDVRTVAAALGREAA